MYFRGTMSYVKTQKVRDRYWPKQNSESKNLQKNLDKFYPIGKFLTWKPEKNAP